MRHEIRVRDRKYGMRNMRILFFISIGILLLGASCSKGGLENIPVEQAFEEPAVALARYVEKLQEPAAGWEFGLVGKQAGFYAGYLDFDQENTARFTVATLAPGNPGLEETVFHTGVAGTNPVLVFPSGAFARFALSQDGVDTSFTFQAIRSDTIFLLGNQHGSELKLTKASPDKAEAYRGTGMLDVIAAMENLQRLPKYFKRLTVNGATYDLHFRPDMKSVYIHYGGTERFAIHETLYSLTATGIYLRQPLIDGINRIDYIDDFSVDASGTTMTAWVGGQPAEFTNEAEPAAYDTTAILAFYNNPTYQLISRLEDNTEVVQRYSVSLDALTVAGETDAYGFGEIAGYQFMVFFHQWVGADFGLFRLAINTDAGNEVSSYGLAFKPHFSTSNGVIGFEFYGTLGAFPADAMPAFEQFAIAIANPYGYYAVRSGPASFDLVSRDISQGQKWIRFE